MATFRKAIQNQNAFTRTENGALTHATAGDAAVDLFFRIGALRKTPDEAVKTFVKAHNDDRNLAIRVALWGRDIRQGAGEREVFRRIMKWLEIHDFDAYVRMMAKVPELGRWDDVFDVPETQRGFDHAIEMIREGLQEKNGLLAKWLPRKGPQAAKIRRALGMSPRFYRKLIVKLSDTVESKMAANEWGSINFDHVPSLAFSRYRKVFEKKAGYVFEKHLNKVEKGEAKINTGAVYPYDVLKGFLSTGGWKVQFKKGPLVKKAAVEQWKALPNFFGNKERSMLAMVDTSGSMTSSVGGNLTCIEVALSVGLYIADKQTGPFKDLMLTFDARPKFFELKGDILSKTETLVQAPWGFNTNLTAAFDEILRMAKKNGIRSEDMPEFLVIISDMEFDPPPSGSTVYKDALAKFKKAGYDRIPTIIGWNIQSRSSGNTPFTIHDENCVLVSGFSPSIVKNILSAKQLDPRSLMYDTVLAERYDY